MVNLKTKLDKHAEDNEKRRKSIKEKEKAKFNQSQIIKQALSNSTLSNSSSKKIIFNEEDDKTNDVDPNNKRNDISGNGRRVLFDSSESEAEDFEIKEKSQFSGRKGFQLLNLQSTYGNDERFKIDERFLEDEKEESNEESKESPEDSNIAGEKAKQLKILESVLGTTITGPGREKKAKKRTNEMVRYDASNEDHKIYEINNQSETAKLTPSKKRKEGRKNLKADKQELPKSKVSKEKFYEVSNEIKNSFKDKKDEGGQFSLLQTYGINGAEKSEDSEGQGEEDDDDFAECMDEDNKNYERSMECKTPDKLGLDEPKIEEKSVLAKGIWKESFFFDQDDPRFKEGLEFINKRDSEEAKEAAENYDKTRKKLKEILRLHLKKQMHKKDPFRNKIGGMNKKQLVGSKFKNSRSVVSNKRKPPKTNRGGRT